MPAHDLVFQILRSKITMAAKWAKSPTKRKTFMAEKLFGQVKLFLEGWHAFKGPTKSPPKDYLFLVKFFKNLTFTKNQLPLLLTWNKMMCRFLTRLFFV